MIYKGLLLDIDDTLYDYDIAHEFALKQVFNYLINNFKYSQTDITNAFNLAKQVNHIQLSETAASHHRLLYFQHMLEILKINPLQYAHICYDIYWDNFLNKMELFEGVEEVLHKYKNKICLVTDMTAHIQYRKIEKLKLFSYIDKMVTSEEVGKEKPHPYIFMSALKKMNLTYQDVCMIGDNFKKDIIGANNMNIVSIWINKKRIENIDINIDTQEVLEFKQIINLI